MNINGLDRDQIKSLADAVLIRRDISTRAILDLLKGIVKEGKSGASGGFLSSAKELFRNPFGTGDEGSSSSRRIVSWGSRSTTKLTKEETLWKGANNFSSSVSDSEFLTQLKTADFDECLGDATAEAEETAHTCLKAVVESLVSGIGQQILSTQKEECDKQIQREVGSAEERELGILRSDFVRQIEELTRQRSRSYVHNILERANIASRNAVVQVSMSTTSYQRRSDTTRKVCWTPRLNHWRILTSRAETYFIRGRHESLQNQEIEYHIHTLRLLAEQSHNLQLDSSFVPTPVLNERLSYSFRVPSDTVVK